jgi:hypothetical protein
MLSKFLSYLEEQVENHSIYVWGAQGQQGNQITEEWIRRRENNPANAARAISFWKKQVQAGYGDILRAFDCSGLGVYFFIKEGLLDKDTTANGLLVKCEKITEDELRPGDFVFHVDSRGRAYHIGYVVDKDRNVVEAQGRDAGVIKSPLKGWNAFGRPPFFIAEKPKNRILKIASPYLRGDDVKELQTALKAKGYSVGKTDGVFGPFADKAVRRFQKDSRLVVDGKAGPKTYSALGLEWRG